MGDISIVACVEPTDGGADPCDVACSPLSVGSDLSPALIDSIIASTSSAVGKSFTVGDDTCPVCTFPIMEPNAIIGDMPEGFALSDALLAIIIS